MPADLSQSMKSHQSAIWVICQIRIWNAAVIIKGQRGMPLAASAVLARGSKQLLLLQ